ncbi:hypothetical protein EYF80_041342 [Liparis tanakae]|uniref:Uncharacterized protein n=1 Tax=Liparis tanakae TaxID=230148 RepID=A0A4Z2G4J6_9TELE|nr:hypothetical protein EYF80_041342 [Liparis tanakae]
MLPEGRGHVARGVGPCCQRGGAMLPEGRGHVDPNATKTPASEDPSPRGGRATELFRYQYQK